LHPKAADGKEMAAAESRAMHSIIEDLLAE
jgi:hypothetical protein